MRINSIKAREVFDSKGNPTISTEIIIDDGATGVAMVPSGSSKGANEAWELRDGDKKRFNGLGVLKAVENVNHKIADHFKKQEFNTQEEFDRELIDLDGTKNKSVLGANAVLSASLAFAKAAANLRKLPLYKYIHRSSTYAMPVPCMNVISGGIHAPNNLDFEEFMIAPHKAPSFKEAIRMGLETFQALRSILKDKGYSTLVGDEGGFAPNLRSNEEAVELLIKAIAKAGYRPGNDISICIDAATTAMKYGSQYVFGKSNNNKFSSGQMIQLWQRWVKDYPILSIEDGLSENDWRGWTEMTEALGDQIELVGDDIFCTNKKLLMDGIKNKAANSVLIKPNQIGTLTETLEAIGLAYANNYNCFVSNRSGETEDTFIADLAVAVSAGHMKTGSGCRGERIAKINRLLQIEEQLGSAATFPGMKAFKIFEHSNMITSHIERPLTHK